MYRTAFEQLYKWKENKNRKPLIIEGARQVGKTWLTKEFGKIAYKDTVYINFDSNSKMADLFSSDLNIERLIMGLEIYIGRKINPDNSLLILMRFRRCREHFLHSNIFMRMHRSTILYVQVRCLVLPCMAERHFRWERLTF